MVQFFYSRDQISNGLAAASCNPRLGGVKMGLVLTGKLGHAWVGSWVGAWHGAWVPGAVMWCWWV